MATPSDSTVKRRLRELRSAVIEGPDPIASQIAYAMECAVRWVIEDTTRWPSLAETARDAARSLRKERRP